MLTQYQALYRQWRPRTFAEVVGQEHITRTLLNAVKNGRLVHAYLFCGPRGTGKTSTAKILAKAVNCQSNRDGEPCNQCPNCKRIDAGNSLDVLEIDAASNRGIDEVRELIEKIPLGAVEGRYKVYIIDEVHMLTTEAFNAILKTLEEPPAHAVFILATTEPRKVLPTILSRCQRFDFHPLAAATIAQRLQEVAAANAVQLHAAALGLLARKANGGLRDALGLLDQILAGGSKGTITADQVAATLGTARLDTLLGLADALVEGDGAGVLRLLDSALQSGVEPKQLLEDLLDHSRNLLLLQTDPRAGRFTGLMPEEVEQVAAQAQKFNNRRLLDLMERLQQGRAALRWSNQPRVLLEMTLIGFIVAPIPSLEDLTRRVEALEKRLVELSGSDRLVERQQAACLQVMDKPAAASRDQASSGHAGHGQGKAPPHSQPAMAGRQQKPGVNRPRGGSSQAVMPEAAGRAEPGLRPGTGAGPGETAPGTANSKVAGEQQLELAAVRDRWSEVLAAARRDSVHLQAYLREGEPVAVTGDSLTVAVKTDFHRGMLEQPANREKVEAVLKRVFGLPLKLVITAGRRTQGEASQEVIDKLKEYFGPDKVEIID